MCLKDGLSKVAMQGSCALVVEYGIPTTEMAQMTTVGPDGSECLFPCEPLHPFPA